MKGKRNDKHKQVSARVRAELQAVAFRAPEEELATGVQRLVSKSGPSRQWRANTGQDETGLARPARRKK